MFIEQKIFENLNNLFVRVTRRDAENFIDAVSNENLPDVILLNVEEGKIKIDRVKKEFRILERRVTSNPEYSEMLLATAIKVACKSGYSIYLEPKYSN